MPCHDTKQLYGELRLPLVMYVLHHLVFELHLHMTFLSVFEQMMKTRSRIPFCYQIREVFLTISFMRVRFTVLWIPYCRSVIISVRSYNAQILRPSVTPSFINGSENTESTINSCMNPPGSFYCRGKSLIMTFLHGQVPMPCKDDDKI